MKRQKSDWKVTVARTSIDRFAYQMVFPYLSVYIVMLGASGLELGFVNTLGMLVAGLVGPFTGHFIDLAGSKRVYLLGIAMVAVSYLVYAVARDWTIAMTAMIIYWLGFSIGTHSCATVCGNCLPNQDRATGMTFCETVAAGALGMIGPILGASLVTASGGLSIEGIRPLFLIGLACSVGSFVFVLFKLTDTRWKTGSEPRTDMARNLYRILKEGRNLKKWLIIGSVGQLPLGMVLPFAPVFAHQVKGADSMTLAAMVTGSALVSVMFAIPLGRLADRLGRKTALFITMPLFWVANLMLLWAPNTTFLVAAGAMLGFYSVGAPISAAMERELVPAEQMARWIGIARFCRMVAAGCAAFAAGALWDRVGPQSVFLVFIGIELIVRLPLLLIMPETLKLSAK